MSPNTQNNELADRSKTTTMHLNRHRKDRHQMDPTTNQETQVTNEHNSTTQKQTKKTQPSYETTIKHEPKNHPLAQTKQNGWTTNRNLHSSNKATNTQTCLIHSHKQHIRRKNSQTQTKQNIPHDTENE